MTERRVLCRDLTPHIPAAAFFDLLVERRRLILTADRGVFHAAAIGNKYQIILRQVNGIRFTVCNHIDARCLLFVRLAVKFHIDHLDAVVELHAEAFQIFDHRQDHRFILIVLGETQRREVRQSADVMDIALDINFHFECAVPVFKREHGPPVQPEVRVQHLIIKEVRNPLVLQLLVRCEEQLHDLHCTLI